ncbi:MAG: NAD(P)/FAD-dependent oxidoreductase [Spirochaetaceae bacterium]|nr:NAD(P)/FAD-dependent oxidoreductase [Spirochaetaceae bacterium]
MGDGEQQVDAVVIGMGPGGEEVAGRLAEAGLAVIGVESELVGGECPYWGCVPSKMMIRGSTLIAEARRADGYAGSATVTPDLGPVAKRIRAEATDNWDDKVAADRFEGKGGRLVRGSAVLDGPGRVRVGEDTFVASRAVVVASGSAPVIPPIEGLADVSYWTNREAISATRAPTSLVVLGGGAVGVELAQMFARYGSEVTVVEAADRILALEEPEASEVVAAALAEDGLTVRTGAKAVHVSREGGDAVVRLEDGTSVRGAELLVSVGRRARVKELGVDSVGLDPDARALEVDDRMRAGERLWGVGDVTGVGAFTHMAMYQAGIAVADILGKAGEPADYRGLSRVTFTDPEVGSVGLTEQAAKDKGLTVRIGTAQVASSARGWIHGPGGAGVIKLVMDDAAGLLVGATSAGPWGGEVLSMLTLAVHAKIPVATLKTMIYAYPTFHGGVLDALTDLDG